MVVSWGRNVGDYYCRNIVNTNKSLSLSIEETCGLIRKFANVHYFENADQAFAFTNSVKRHTDV